MIREESAIDYLEGLFGAVTNETVEFELDGDKIPVKRSKGRGTHLLPRQTNGSTAWHLHGNRSRRLKVSSLVHDAGRRQTSANYAGRRDASAAAIERVSAIAFPARYLSDFKTEHILFETRLREPRGVAERIKHVINAI